MTDQPHPDPDLAGPPAWHGHAAIERWGDLSVDQPDGFASTLDEPEPPPADVSDDEGYGFGV
jgi:hypothetical protein